VVKAYESEEVWPEVTAADVDILEELPKLEAKERAAKKRRAAAKRKNAQAAKKRRADRRRARRD
jgi:hypothetical protein